MISSHSDTALLVDLDETDKQLLRLLQTQARMSITELAERVNLSATPCARRIKRLEDAGIITGYHTKTDAQKLVTHWRCLSLSVWIATQQSVSNNLNLKYKALMK